MSFDIFFMPCRFGDRLIEEKNELTGETRSVLPNEPLTADELKAVEEVLEEATVRGSGDPGYYVVRAKDGGEAEVFASDLGHGCMVALRGITPGLLGSLINLLKAGNWCMVPIMEDNVAIVPSLRAVKSVPDDFPQIVVCDSGEELGTLLSGGFCAWKKYRDQVVGDGA
jgi:hypothetical protein